MVKKFLIRGKLRTKDNKLAKGFKIEAFDSDGLLRDDLLGEAVTDSNGIFHIEFSDLQYNEFWMEGRPDVYLKIYNRNGKLLVKTKIEKTGSEIEYQIILGSPRPAVESTDIYSDNVNRIVSMTGGVNDMLLREYQINLATLNSDRIPTEIKQRFQRFLEGHEQRVKNIETISALVDGLVSSQLETMNLSRIGYDGPQVPLRPRREAHHHVIIWPRKE